ncbi:AaceriAGR313Wp [[Ashbya] aceris (nom. inval.)]|nr:AaceriAGR313Wp [[Ashbya] aceris (nom. inval.)]
MKNLFRRKKRQGELTTSVDEKLHMGGTVVHGMKHTDYDSIKPILMLLDAQERKTYMNWDHGIECRMGSNTYQVSSLLLTGTDLRVRVWDPSSEYDIISVVGMQDLYAVLLSPFAGNEWRFNDEITLIIHDPVAMSRLERAIALVYFEKWSLHKSLTATLLSTVGLQIPDIHLILKSPHVFQDWCHIYVGDEWMKVWVHIDGSPKHRLKSMPFGIKFFKDNKVLNKKNLICYIAASELVEEAFFVPHAGDALVTDSSTLKIDSITSFLAQLDTIRYMGPVWWPVDRQDAKSQSSSHSSPPSSQKASEPTKAGHSRSFSVLSGLSQSDADPVLDTVQLGGLLIRPIPHGGIHHLESLVRFIIPFYDSLHLYGRPKRFNIDPMDPESLLFALPKLPSIDYLTPEEFELFLYEPFDRQNAWSQIKDYVATSIRHPARTHRQPTSICSVLDLQHIYPSPAGAAAKPPAVEPAAHSA